MKVMLFSLLFTNPLLFLIVAAVLIATITIHEFAHAWAANRLGDPTAKHMGRLTLNPLAHLDPLGTLLIFVAGFGWGKPVLFNPHNLDNPRRDSALVALAGPVSNVLMAILIAILLRVVPHTSVGDFVGFLLVQINISLALFNLIPIHPLDGGKILIGLAPHSLAVEWDDILEKYGSFLLIFMILPLANGVSAASLLIGPISRYILNILLPS